MRILPYLLPGIPEYSEVTLGGGMTAGVRSVGGFKLVTVLGLIIAWFDVGLATVRAQEGLAGGTTAGEVAGIETAAAVPSAEELAALRAAIADDSEIPNALKPFLDDQYQRAIELLADAANSRETEASYRAALESAPSKLREIHSALAAPSMDQPPLPATLEKVDQAIASAQAGSAEATAELADVAAQLEGAADLPLTDGPRLRAARADLTGANADVAGLAEDPNPSLGEAAALTLALTRREALAAEIAMIEMERTSREARLAALDARSKLLARDATALKQRLRRLEDHRIEIAAQNAADAIERAREVARDDASVLPRRREEAGRILALARQNEETARRVAAVTAGVRESRQRRDQLQATAASIREQFELGGLRGNFVDLLRNRQAAMIAPDALTSLLRSLRNTLATAQLEEFALRRELDSLQTETSDGADELQITKRDLLEATLENYRDLIRGQTAFIALEQDTNDIDAALRDFLLEKLFWVRSLPPLGIAAFAQIPGAWQRFLTANDGSEPTRVLAFFPRTRPVTTGIIALALIIPLAFRSRLLAALKDSGQQTRRIASDTYRQTVRALVITLVLASPIPIVLTSLSVVLGSDPTAASWIQGLAEGLHVSAIQSLGVFFLHAVCRPGGLGELHFLWDPSALRQIQRTVLVLFAIVLPSNLFIWTTLFASPDFVEGLGRLTFIASQLAIAAILYHAFRPEGGIASGIVRKRPNGLVARTRRLWLGILVGSPLILAALAWLGYFITATSLSDTTIATHAWIAGAFVIHALILRWFLIRERRLALQEAVETRRARARETRESETKPDGLTDDIEVDAAEADLDVEAIGAQTRRLVNVLVIVSLLVALYYLWTTQLPGLRVIETIRISGALTLSGLLQAVIAGFVTVVVARNLPGLLDIALLRGLQVESGTRKAVATLCQYAVILIGLGFALQFLHLDWSRFAWIAAALSVGIGFGLQEVVANFICGIIILFERPIRIGDTVTIQEIEGVVTRVQMRATTITNWERKDFLVPNKEIVNGTLMNWTLTTAINRVTIPVGVAYGTDIERACAILQEIAEAHPEVLDDPAPFTSFQDFGDSALIIDVRVYITDVNRRIGIYSAIRKSIARRFAEAEIEIAFPQRDLNLKSISPEVREALGLRRPDDPRGL